MAHLDCVPLEHEPLDVGELLVHVLEAALRLKEFGVSHFLLVIAQDPCPDALRASYNKSFVRALFIERALLTHLPHASSLALPAQLLPELGETLRDPVSDLVQIAVLIVLRVELVLERHLTRHRLISLGFFVIREPSFRPNLKVGAIISRT